MDAGCGQSGPKTREDAGLSYFLAAMYIQGSYFDQRIERLKFLGSVYKCLNNVHFFVLSLPTVSCFNQTEAERCFKLAQDALPDTQKEGAVIIKEPYIC